LLALFGSGAATWADQISGRRRNGGKAVGYRSVLESEAWLVMGASGHLNKPFTPAELRAVVEDAFASTA
jgi:hypothetical protein